jgi:photosystem II stability/assembly factor-like uncharacterized protein
MRNSTRGFRFLKQAGTITAVCAMGLLYPVQGQDFIDQINQDHVDFEKVRKQTENYFDDVGRGKGSGYKLFKRWEYRAQSRTMADGKVVSSKTLAQVLKQSRTSYQGKTAMANWSELGPLAWTNTAGYNPGVGRITAVAVEPTSQQLIYVGSPGGGLWKTTNGGSSWTPLGDNFDNMDIWGISIDPSNNNIVYVGNSTGELYKSTNGGASFSLLMDQNFGRVFTILVHPTNSNIMHVAIRSNGLFRTTDGGANWTEVITVDIEDVAYKPGSTSTIYACGSNFYKSTNSGSSFTQISSGFESSQRMKLAVTPANSNYVYVVQRNGGQFGWLYKSTNSGTDFSVMQEHTSSTNYIGNQASRDMAIAVSNTDEDEVHMGGFDMYVSTNGGTSFTQECDWYYPSTTPGGSSSGHSYVHADIEVMQYLNGNIFVGSDGGIFKSTDAGDNFVDLSTGLGVHQFYRINSSATDKNRVIGGAQDNGTNVMSGPSNSWVHMMGADGMDCAVHPTNSDILFGCYQYGGMVKSTNGGTTRTSMVAPPESGSGNWVTPIAIDPNNGSRIYAGYAELYRHNNLASSGSWVTTSTGISFNAKLRNIEMCPSNSNVIYVSTTSRIYKSSDILAGTPTWTEISGLSGTINDIAVDYFDENRVVVSTSAGNLYESTDGGSNWTNINSGLPSVPFTSVVLDRSANQGIYVSIDGAVYFKNNTLTNWITYSTNLPKMDIDEVELFYGGAGESRVRIGTYGRGLWESPLYDDAEDGGSTGGLTCATTINSLPYNEGFESGLGAWTQATGDDTDWTRKTGTTTSSGTGPSGAAVGSYYMYLETSSPNYPSKTAYLESPCFNFSSGAELEFQYHMLGSAVGSLNLEVTTNGTSWTSIWSRSADQGSAWNTGTVNLASYAGSDFKLRFNATSGSSWQGDICIDDLQFSAPSGPSCTSTVNSFPYSESFEPGFGVWSQSTADDIDWTRKTGTTTSSGTGPSGASDGSYYMYLETSSPNYPTKTAYLESACFDLGATSNPELTFDYHMLGSAVGSLNLEITTDGVIWTSIWSRSADQGRAWNAATVDLSAYSSTVRLRFNATSGNSWQGDICIDKLSISGTGPSAPGVIIPTVNECFKLQLQLDDYPVETSWEIREDGSLIASGENYSNSKRGALIEEEFCTSAGCFEFTIKDSYGDGICCERGEGSFQIVDQDGKVVASGGDFGKTQTIAVCENQSQSNSAQNTLDVESVLIFPNPAIHLVHVQLRTKGEDVEVHILDAQGKVVAGQPFETAAGLNLLKVSLNDLAAGSYLVRVKRGGATQTQKLIINE